MEQCGCYSSILGTEGEWGLKDSRIGPWQEKLEHYDLGKILGPVVWLQSMRLSHVRSRHKNTSFEESLTHPTPLEDEVSNLNLK